MDPRALRSIYAYEHQEESKIVQPQITEEEQNQFNEIVRLNRIENELALYEEGNRHVDWNLPIREIQQILARVGQQLEEVRTRRGWENLTEILEKAHILLEAVRENRDKATQRNRDAATRAERKMMTGTGAHGGILPPTLRHKQKGGAVIPLDRQVLKFPPAGKAIQEYDRGIQALRRYITNPKERDLRITITTRRDTWRTTLQSIILIQKLDKRPVERRVFNRKPPGRVKVRNPQPPIEVVNTRERPEGFGEEFQEVWGDIKYGDNYMERMREGRKGTHRRVEEIKRLKKEFKSELEEKTLQNIKQNDHIDEFRYKDVARIIMRAAYGVMHQGRMMNPRQILKQFQEEKDAGTVSGDIWRESLKQLKLSGANPGMRWDQKLRKRVRMKAVRISSGKPRNEREDTTESE